MKIWEEFNARRRSLTSQDILSKFLRLFETWFKLSASRWRHELFLSHASPGSNRSQWKTKIASAGGSITRVWGHLAFAGLLARILFGPVADFCRFYPIFDLWGNRLRDKINTYSAWRSWPPGSVRDSTPSTRSLPLLRLHHTFESESNDYALLLAA